MSRPWGMLRQACAMVNRYGEELEYDLHAYCGLNIHDWFTGADAYPWGKLLRMSERLPSHGQYKAAVLDDDEYAEMVGLPPKDEEPEKRRVGFVEYDPQYARLTDIADLLISLRSTLIAINSEKKVKEPKYLPRPQSAFDRLERREAKQTRNQLRSILTPDG